MVKTANCFLAASKQQTANSNSVINKSAKQASFAVSVSNFFYLLVVVVGGAVVVGLQLTNHAVLLQSAIGQTQAQTRVQSDTASNAASVPRRFAMRCAACTDIHRNQTIVRRAPAKRMRRAIKQLIF